MTGAVRISVEAVIDSRRISVNISAMDVDENLPRRSDDPVNALARQDLDPLSVTELEARIVALTQEIERTKAKIKSAVNHKASADALFRK